MVAYHLVSQIVFTAMNDIAALCITAVTNLVMLYSGAHEDCCKSCLYWKGFTSVRYTTTVFVHFCLSMTHFYMFTVSLSLTHL